MDTNEFLNPRQAGRWLGVAVRTLEKWRAEGRGPVFHQFGRSIRYRVDKLERFAARAERARTSVGAARRARTCAGEPPAPGTSQ